jgi:hypothetical protein
MRALGPSLLLTIVLGSYALMTLLPKFVTVHPHH